MWPLLLTHHLPRHAERCVYVGPLPVCRRCLACWPLAGAVLLAGLTQRLGPAPDVELALWLGPAAGEYAATHAGRIGYSKGRTWIFGALLGLAAGRLLHRYLLNPADPMVWTLGACAALPATAALIVHHRKEKKLAEE